MANVNIPTIPAAIAGKLISFEKRFGWLLSDSVTDATAGPVTLAPRTVKALGDNAKKLSASEALLLMLGDATSPVCAAIIEKHKPKTATPADKPAKPSKPRAAAALKPKGKGKAKK